MLRVWFLLVIMCGLAGVPVPASAAIAGCTDSAPYCDQGEAAMSCEAAKAAVVPPTAPWVWKVAPECIHSSSSKRYYCNASITHPGSGNVVSRFCGYHYYLDSCDKRNVTYPPGDAALNYVPISDCVGGCRVVGESFSSTMGGVTVYGMRNRTYVNEACSVPINANAPIDAQAERQDATKPQPPECTALGAGQTGCKKPNGDYCATASTGKTFCWTPGQEGAQVDGEQAQVKGETGDPVKPPDVAVPDKDWQRKEGHQVAECTASNCKTFNVTNFTTVPQGTAKNSTGDNKPDGSGNTSGNGQNDQGGKDSATDSGNCTTPPVCVGDTLKCLHLRYTWKVQCNTAGNEITAGQGCSEGDVPVCAGSSCKAEAYASVLQQWKQRCALEAMAAGNKARADGIDNGADAGVVDGIWTTPGGNGPLTLRTDLVQVGGNGSLLPEIEIEGQTWNVPQGFFDAIAAVRMVIIAMCTVLAMFIVGRNI
jgi:hypothetical protein